MHRALVTGGNRGIGKEIAAGLVAQGFEVLVGSRDPAAGEAVAAEIGARSVPLDLSDPEAREVGALEATILVNNAGVLWSGGVFDKPEQFETSMDVMLSAPYALIRACLPAMRETGYGRIVNVSSGWGSFSQGLGGGGAYAVAKAALNALTVIADRDTPDFIKINAMCPGWVRTRMGGSAASRSPEEGADTAIWLATLPDDGPSGGFYRDRKPIQW